MGFALSAQAPGSGSTTPTAFFDSAGANDTITIEGAGLYQVLLPALVPSATGADDVQVSSTAANATCQAQSWAATADGGSSAETVNVACHGTSAAPINAPFIVNYPSSTVFRNQSAPKTKVPVAGWARARPAPFAPRESLPARSSPLN